MLNKSEPIKSKFTWQIHAACCSISCKLNYGSGSKFSAAEVRGHSLSQRESCPDKLAAWDHNTYLPQSPCRWHQDYVGNESTQPLFPPHNNNKGLWWFPPSHIKCFLFGFAQFMQLLKTPSLHERGHTPGSLAGLPHSAAHVWSEGLNIKISGESSCSCLPQHPVSQSTGRCCNISEAKPKLQPPSGLQCAFTPTKLALNSCSSHFSVSLHLYVHMWKIKVMF